MDKPLACLYAAIFLGGTPAHSQTSQRMDTPAPTNEQTAALKAVKIDARTVTSLERSDSPTLTFPDGHTVDHLPLRTVRTSAAARRAVSRGLQEAQRYPEDYDGIFAGIAAHCRTPLHAYFLWNDQILTRCPFTPEQQDHVTAAGIEYMASRESPNVAGKFVSDPRGDAWDIEAVIALAMKKDLTLAPAHADALRKIFDGPRHAVTGERISTDCRLAVPSRVAR